SAIGMPFHHYVGIRILIKDPGKLHDAFLGSGGEFVRIKAVQNTRLESQLNPFADPLNFGCLNGFQFFVLLIHIFTYGCSAGTVSRCAYDRSSRSVTACRIYEPVDRSPSASADGSAFASVATIGTSK